MEPARTILITIEYDGSAFHGWQIQRRSAESENGTGGADGANGPDGAGAGRVRTVQGVLEQAISRVCGEDINLNGTSRTDAGVHAFGQAASFTGSFGIPTERIPAAVNNLLDDVRVLSAADVPDGFHARFKATGKTYLYRIVVARSVSIIGQKNANLANSAGDIFLKNYRYILNKSIDEGKMEEAAKHLVGTFDFAAFRTAGGAGSGGTVRTVAGISVAGRDAADTKGNPVRETEIRVTGESFMYNMVRIIVGTLVEVGFGKRAPADMGAILKSKDRAMAGHTAPAAGLYLEKVYFE